MIPDKYDKYIYLFFGICMTISMGIVIYMVIIPSFLGGAPFGRGQNRAIAYVPVFLLSGIAVVVYAIKSIFKRK